MLRNRVLVALLSAAVLTTPMAAWAAPPAAAAPAPSDARKLDLAKRLFTSMHTDKLMHDAMAGMMPRMVEQMRRSHPEITADQAKAITDATTETMDEIMAEVVQKMIPVYAETFTEKELEDTVAFYEGPSGSAMLAKLPALMARMSPMMSEMAPKMAERLQARICSKIDCKPAPKANKS